MALVGNISGSGGVSNTIGITGSLIIANPGLLTFPGFPGTDVTFFVSGNASTKPSLAPDYTVRGTSVFQGDVVISGTLFGGSPLFIGSPITASAGIAFTSTDPATFSYGLSGSLTRLVNGSSYLVAGTNVSISSESNGQITISSTAGGGTPGGSDTQVQFNDGGSFNGVSDFVFNKTTNTLSVANFSVTGSGVVSLTGDLKVGGNDIQASDGQTNITLTSNTLTTFAGDIKVGGNDIQASDGTAAISLSGADVTVAGDLSITGGKITLTNGSTIDSETTDVLKLTESDVRIIGQTLSTDQTTFNLINATATTVNLAGAATALTIGANGSGTTTVRNNLTVSGDLTVNGTTTTIDTANLLVEDPLILMSKGTGGGAGTSRNGGIAIFSGSADAEATGARSDLVFGRVDADTWGAGKFNTANGTETNLTTMRLVPLRASKLEVGSNTAYVSSSDGNDIIIDAGSTSTATFKFGGSNSLQISPYSADDEPVIKSVSSPYRDLFVSGTRILLGHDATGGYVGVQYADLGERAQLIAGNADFTVRASQPGFGSQTLILSGSEVRLAAQNGATGITFYDASAQFASFVNNSVSSARTMQSVGANSSLILAAGGGGGAGDIIVLSGSRAKIQVGAINPIAFERDGTPFLTFTSGSGATNNTTIATSNSTILNLFNTTATSVNAFAAGTDVNIGSTAGGSNIYLKPAATNVSGTLTVAGIINANNGTVTTTQTTFNLINTTATTVNFAGAGTNISVGSVAGGSNIYLKSATANLSGSMVIAGNIDTAAAGAKTLYASAGANNVTIGGATSTVVAAGDLSVNGNTTLGNAATDTTTVAGSLAVNGTAASSTNKITSTQTSFNLLNDTVTTLSVGGAATTLNVATAATTTGTYNLITGAAATGQTKTINLGTGGDTGSTTNINLGSTAGGTITSNMSIVPASNTSYDLGSPSLRWRNMYTGDLHLKNDRGNWTIIEERDFLTITNNTNGKRYKFVLEEI